ncbi:hypothetical protein [Pseudogracilibacillus sp. SO10305]|uniref:hypothetical protein n=1 Tax=Pseudogracilibacillus sp. SO10305 TaxID=3098292 RepID=UPI00300E472F
MLYRLDNYNLKLEKGEGKELKNLDLSYAVPNCHDVLFCLVFASVELNEYRAYLENVEVTDAGTRLLFKEINEENVRPFYKLYWIPAEYDYVVEGLPLIFECIDEPDHFGTIEELMAREVIVREVISSPKKDSCEMKDERRAFPVNLYSLGFII